MEYNKRNLIKDFFTRTYKNLETYKKNHSREPDKYEYEITMTINSLLGLLVFAKEYDSINYDNINIDHIIKKAKYANKSNEKTVKDFFRHMRNSIAHGRCLEGFDVDNTTHNIKKLKFLDYNNKDKTFEVYLTISDMNKIIKELKNNITTS